MSSPLWLRLARLLTPVCLIASCLRGQITESPQTIEPGKVLIRMDALSVGIKPDSSAPGDYQALGVANTIVSAGLTDTVDFEVGAQFFLRDTLHFNQKNLTEDGIGDVTLRSKWTFWHDTTADQEAAIEPVIKIPTNSNGVGNHSVEGGLILPWAVKLPAGASAGAMLEWDELRNVADTRYVSRWYAGGVLSWNLIGGLGAYAESTMSVSTEGTSTFVGTAGAGATLSVSKNFQWDFEVSRVFGQSATDWAETLRFRWRL